MVHGHLNINALIAAIVIVLIAFICLATAMFLRATGEQALEQFRDHSLLSVENAAGSISRYISYQIGKLEYAALFANPSERSAESLEAVLKKFYEREGGSFACITWYDAEGSVTFTYPPDAVQADVSIEEEEFESGTADPRSKVVRVLTTAEGCEAALLLVPMVSEGIPRGAVGGLLDLSYVKEDILGKLTEGREIEVLLCDGDGNPIILLSPRPSSGSGNEKNIKEQKSSGLDAIIKSVAAGDEGFESFEKPGTRDGQVAHGEILVGYAPVRLPAGRWTLGMAVPRSAARGYLVRSPMTVISIAATRIFAVLVCAAIFFVFNKQRVAANLETKRLRQDQKLLDRLEESEERYRILVDNLLSPVVIFQDSRIKIANRVFYSLTGYTPEEVAEDGFELFSLVHEDDRQLSMENATRLLDGEVMNEPREIRFVKKSGEIITGLAFSSVIHFEGRRAIETVVVDISKIKKMEQELSETKKRLEYLLDNAPIMIFSLDQEGNFSYANKETLRTTGYHFNDWAGRPFAPIVHPDDLPIAVSNFEKARKSASRRDYKLRILNANGELRVLNISAGTILNDEQFEGSLIIASDITEQQRLQQAIKETRDHLANIIENAGDAIITLDKEGNVVSWNKSAEQLFAFVESETFNKPLDSVLKVNRAQLENLFDRVIKGETVRDAEVECSRFEVRLDTLFTLSPIRDASGKVVGISCFAKDITERRRLEKRLERDKRFIDRLIENANALILVANEKGKTVIFNRRFEELTGYGKEEAFGKDPLELLVPEEYRKAAAKKFAEVRGNKPLIEIEVPIVSKDGKTLKVTWNAAAVSLPSGRAAIVVVGQDVTRQKKMHEELIQSKKLASIGELVSGVAHELNNPLTIIMGYSQLLTAEQGLLKRHHDMARKILDAAGRSKRIVDNLLAFARKKKMQKQEVNINEIIESTLLLREHNLMVNNIKIIRRYDETLPSICADGHQLQQVILNLINNSFDAMSQTHRSGVLEVRTGRRGSKIVVEVTDTGPGVPKHAQDKIFDPFFTTKEVGKGTGLGMSLSYGIIKEHGGTIYLDKAHRPGAKFVIELPLNPRPSPAPIGQRDWRIGA